MIIIAIVVVLLLAGFFALIQLTPHKGAGLKPNPQRGADGSLHPKETRTSDLN
jgi:hypothetical protein